MAIKTLRFNKRHLITCRYSDKSYIILEKNQLVYPINIISEGIIEYFFLFPRYYDIFVYYLEELLDALDKHTSIITIAQPSVWLPAYLIIFHLSTFRSFRILTV